jgi:hypothetical protein
VTSALGSVAMWSAIAEAVGVFFDQLDTKNVDVDKLTNSLQQFVDTGKSAGEMKNIFGDNFDNLGNIAQYAQSATSGYGKFVDSVANSLPGIGAAGKGIGDFASRLISGTDFDTAKQQMASLDTSLTQTMTTMNDSRKASDLWNKVLSQSGLDTDQLAQLLPNAYTEVGALNTAADKGKSSVGGLGAAAQNAAGATGDLGSALKVGASAQKSWANEADAAAGAARGEIGALSDLNARMKAQVNPVFGLLTAEKDLTAARKAATDAVHKYGRNSDQAKESTQKLTMAAISLQGAAGAAAGTIDGKMTPALVQTLHAAGFTDSQIKDVAKQFRQAKTDADKYAGNYAANVTITGAGKVEAEFRKLSAQQQALKSGNTIARLSGTGDGPGFAGGGWTGPGSKYQPAGVVHADEHVIQKESRQNLEAVKPGALDYMNQTGKWPGYATGGMVWPFPVDASKTKIPQPAFSAPGGIGGNVAQGGGPGYKWMEAVVRAAFPGMPVYSDYRPGAITLTGNRSYHSVGRAVDFAPSLPLAEWINLHFMRQTKELITPWQSLNIHNGQRHQYSALIENQHNFAGGNAHDHWAMANGGMITEPVFGIGASGRTYSFGENYQPERVIPQWQTGGGSGQGATVNVTFSGPVGSQYQLQTWLASSIDDLRRKGKI